MATKTRTISLRIPEKLYQRLQEASNGGSVSSWITRAIEDRLENRPVVIAGTLTERQQQKVVTAQVQAGRTVIETVNDFIAANPTWFEKLPEDQQGKIISAIGLKLAQRSDGTDAGTVSLRESLKGLDQMEDITSELSRVKGELFKAERERDMALQVCHRCRDINEKSAFVELAWEGWTEVCWQWIVRNALPGIGDGGGLTEAGREEVAKEVLKWLEKNVKTP